MIIFKLIMSFDIENRAIIQQNGKQYRLMICVNEVRGRKTLGFEVRINTWYTQRVMFGQQRKSEPPPNT